MMTSETSAESKPRQRAFGDQNRIHLLLCAIALPILIWGLNTVVVQTGMLRAVYHLALPCCCIFVLEIALISWCVGSFVEHPVLKTIVFLWCILFVDLMFVLIRYRWYSDFYTVSYAFASAQLGLLIAWAMLGTSSMVLRSIAGPLGFVAIMMYAAALRGYGDWGTILTWQAISTFLLCAALRLYGFKIIPDEELIIADHNDANENKEPVQFSIMHLLIWTSALAPIFAIARLVDWNAFDFSTTRRFGQFMLLAVTLAFTSLVSIWSGLGSGRILLRLAVAFLWTTCAGFLFAYVIEQGWLDQLYLDLYGYGTETYTVCIAWTVLAGFFYFAMLLVLRTSDLRLAKS